MNEWWKTGTPALDHDFTSEFIDEEADTGTEGFYLFESGTGQFQMDFPGEFEMLESSGLYSIVENRFEIFNAQKVRQNENKGLSSMFKVTYNGEFSEREKELAFENLLKEFSYEGQYEPFETEDVYGYYGESIGELKGSEMQISDPNSGTTNQYYAFIENKHSNDVISLTYTLVCENGSEQTCVIDEEKDKALFTHIIESIQFNNNEGK
ncbi:hypothetical protein HUG15_15965 [Salicibibacter cibarius]|uniref:DUF3805 domain-containing protein n=1 Tax=Salicibibacter cibarius TaxID=2743000 RepID=A0A7T6Z5T4_9BACI|nr:hypothetical protein [Salicibibacter cibarius]QQK76916.1 hypothetical protein HUG15_15965 [Salicibibacter cibarius]